jgi:hypothetical protein
VSYWNTIAIQTIVKAGQGPVPASRSLAIVQIAIHDALNTIDTRYKRYALRGTAPNGGSADAAIATAAEDALIGAIGVGQLPFLDFGSPALQTAALQDFTIHMSRPSLRVFPTVCQRPTALPSGTRPLKRSSHSEAQIMRRTS